MMTGHDEALHEIDVNHPYYMERLLECNDAEVTHINLNLKHLNAFSEALYRKVIAYPAVRMLQDSLKKCSNFVIIPQNC